jgi:hypothetical protein
VALLLAALAVALLTWQPVWDLFRKNGPFLVQSGVSELWRSAHASRFQDDLQVVYGKIRNDRDGGGDPAAAKDAEIWLEAFDVLGQRVGSAKGNWLDLSTGKPNDLDGMKALTLRPTRQEYGIEIGGKFIWGDDAWIAGEADPPSLTPGGYTMRASISHAHGRAVVFEWKLNNPGVGKPLHVAGLKSARAARMATLVSASNAEAPLVPAPTISSTSVEPAVHAPGQRLIRNLDIGIQFMQGKLRNIAEIDSNTDEIAGELAHAYKQTRTAVLQEHPRFAGTLTPLDTPLATVDRVALVADAEQYIGLLDRVRAELRTEYRS